MEKTSEGFLITHKIPHQRQKIVKLKMTILKLGQVAIVSKKFSKHKEVNELMRNDVKLRKKIVPFLSKDQFSYGISLFYLHIYTF